MMARTSVPFHLRIARPVTDLAYTVRLYCVGLEMRVLDAFAGHAGIDGVILGWAGAGYHFEFTYCSACPLVPAPTAEDLVVFYVENAAEWRRACERMTGAGFIPVDAFNPYWEARGRTFQDKDGYRIVLQNAAWPESDRLPAHA